MSDIKRLLEAMDSMSSAESHPRGPKFTGYWKGTDKGTPGTKMVGGESVLKDLGRGPSKDRNVEKELQEMWASFQEDNFGTHPKRPARKGTREDKVGPRGHKEIPRYKKVKEATPPGVTAPGTTPPTAGGQPPVNPQDAAALKQSLAKLKTSVPGLDVTKAATTMGKADTGTQLNPQDQKVVSTMAPQIANVMKNPQMAGQLKMMIDKAGKTE